jgi:hypothetical protein
MRRCKRNFGFIFRTTHHNKKIGCHVYTYTLPCLIDLLYEAVRVGAADITARLQPGEKKTADGP